MTALELEYLAVPPSPPCPCAVDELTSRCIECSELECDHATSRRYLPPFHLELVEGIDPASYRWHVTDLERFRFENPSSSWPETQRSSETADQPRPLADLLEELERRVDLSLSLEMELRELYDLEPLKVSRVVVALLEGAASGRLHSPGGFLAKRLRELRGRVDR